MSRIPLRVALRADASIRLGLGHVKRCLALAQALRACGAEVVLIAHDLDVDSASLAREAAIQRISLGETARSWEQDARATAAALGTSGAHWLAVDHYDLDARWHLAVADRLGARIAAIDDLADRPLAAEVLIDHNYSKDHRAKYAGRLRTDATLLGGPRFALLDPAYAEAPRHVARAEVGSIGIFMGGTDAPRMSEVALEACRRHARFAGSIEIATTRANQNLAHLQQLGASDGNTTILAGAPNLVGFYARHDLQIGAGGGASWERCCIGAPTLAVSCAANQEGTIRELAAIDAVATLAPGVAPTSEAIGGAVGELVRDGPRRESLATNSRKLVDGLGARRVALHLAADALQVRLARPEDAKMMYDWRNHEVTRLVSADAREIPWTAHADWLRRSLTDPGRTLLIGCVGAVPAGVVRFDHSAAGTLVSLYLDPAMHGLGLGTRLLRAGEEYFTGRNGYPAGGFVATVLGQNSASRRLFQSAGYRDQGCEWRKGAPQAGAGSLQ